MQNPVCISTGCLYLLTRDKNEAISELREFSPAGIELSFAYPECLFNFIINRKNLEYLQTLKFNSIHAPWKDVVYNDNKRSKDTLEAIERLYKEINARNVVFHKHYSDDINLIQSYDFVASIENADWRKDIPTNGHEGIEELLNENLDLKFTFDFAHAITVSLDHIPIYINKFKERIIEIHFAALDKESGDHLFLCSYNEKEIGALLNHLKNTNFPLVLEGVVSANNKVQLIKDEIEYIRTV
jgi:hypothetical protein